MSPSSTAGFGTRHQPTVWVVAGPAGSGKSTLGRAIATAIGAAILDQDVLTNPLMARIAELVGAGNDLDHPQLRGAVRRARYECLINAAADNRRIGRSVVMIAPFTAEISDPALWRSLEAVLAPAPVVLVYVRVPADIARQRRVRRNLARDRPATADRTKPDQPDLPPVRPTPTVPHLLADGTADARLEARRLIELVGDHRVKP